jgi:hypothetical protein
MFHPSQLERVEDQIYHDLELIGNLGSVKLYLCWYDEFLLPESEWNGKYPCSDRTVSVEDVIQIVKKVMIRPCIIRHNVLLGPLPAALNAKAQSQSPLETYVEVCLVY